MAIQVLIDNSYSQITGLSREQHKALAHELSYTLDPKANYFSGGFGPTRRSLVGKNGHFPTGLLARAVAELKKLKINTTCKDLRKLPGPPQMLFDLKDYPTPYRAQTEAVEAAQRVIRGTIVMPTGCGKSLTMALLIDAMQLRTLVIVPNLQLKSQLQHTFVTIFGTTNISQYVTVENIDNPDLKNHTDYDCLILDEGHHSAAKTYRDLNKTAWKGIYRRYFFTATPFRSQEGENMLLESIIGQVIYRIEYQDAVDQNLIVPMEAYYLEIPKTTTSGNSWAKVYNDLVVSNSSRNDIIRDLMGAFKMGKKSTLVLVKEILHGLELSKEEFPFMKGENDDNTEVLERFNKGASTLVATTGVCGEGVDTRPAEYVIIAGLGKSRNAFMQQCGRGFRKYPGKESCKIIIFKDLSHKWTKEHFRVQCQVLREEYNVTPVKLDI